ncbi:MULTISPECIES: IS110 family transposase [Rhodococcus]|uniref:IS110 family transposase n=1 Tax=Rhodococcus opacus TaxID=37919 RepID=UPI001ED94D37|nr:MULTISPECIES: IS110 family transposase [Rhodococcus]
METALGRQASALLATLNIECVNADNLNEAATEAFRQHPDHRIVTSFPGLGGHRARVLAEIGDDRGRFADARGLKAFAGSAPVTRASGRSTCVTHRHVKNNRLAAVGFVWVFAAIPRPVRSRTTMTGAEHTATGTPAHSVTSSTDSWASSITVFKPTKPTTNRRLFPAPSMVRNQQ